MFEQIFKNLEDTLRRDAGCSTALDQAEQISWLLFLKHLDMKDSGAILSSKYQWHNWIKYDSLIEFTNSELFPYLQTFKQFAKSSNTIEYKIGEIFGGLSNKFTDEICLREAITAIDKLAFQTQSEKHELSYLYESKLQLMGNAGRNGGEYYTPRALIRAILNVVNPTIGETIYDGACGSGGFLCEGYDYLYREELSEESQRILQTQTFFGKEKKVLAYVLATMNMILHGVDAPNIIIGNTLTDTDDDFPEFDVIVANPPFGGKESSSVKKKFPIPSSETSNLFLQHFLNKLKIGGRAAVILTTAFLYNENKSYVELRKALLLCCNLHTILTCPQGLFLGTGVSTVVLFFTKIKPFSLNLDSLSTKQIWFYELNLGRKLGKTNPINDNDLVDFIESQKHFSSSDKSWIVDVSALDQKSFKLPVKKPACEIESIRENPEDILNEIIALNESTGKILASIKDLFN